MEQAFTTHPSATFTIEELMPFCFPGMNRPEKKHRVVILRAAVKVAPRMGWQGRRAERPGGQVI